MTLRTQAIERQARYYFTGEEEDRDEAISLYLRVVALTASGDPDLAFVLANVAWCVTGRYSRKGDMSDLAKAIDLGRQALELHDEGHPDRLRVLLNLASVLVSRYRRRHRFIDLDEAFELYYTELDLQLKRPTCSSKDRTSLYRALHAASEPLHHDSDHTADATKIHQDKLLFYPETHSNHATALDLLGYMLISKFQQSHDVEDINSRVEYHERALKLRSKRDRDYPVSLSALANAIYARYIKTRNVDDLERGVELCREALAMEESSEHPTRHLTSLTDLSNLLFSLHSWKQEAAILDESMQLQVEAVRLTPEGHDRRPETVATLGRRFYYKFAKTGQEEYLAQATILLRQAVDLHPIRSPSRTQPLSSLTDCLLTRFELTRDEADLIEASEKLRQILASQPPGHYARRETLFNLAEVYTRKWDLSRKEADLAESIRFVSEAANIRGDTHPMRHLFIHQLGESLHVRFKLLGQEKDLEDAFNFMQQSLLDKEAPKDRARSAKLEGHAALLWSRFCHRRNPADFVNAVKVYREGLGVTVEGHPGRPMMLYCFAMFLWRSFREGEGLEDGEEVLGLAQKSWTKIPASELFGILSQTEDE